MYITHISKNRQYTIIYSTNQFIWVIKKKNLIGHFFMNDYKYYLQK